jgi:hypothetical protein
MVRGITTKQMIEAPHGAFFVWPVKASISYAKYLSHFLGRSDLKIISYNDIEHIMGFENLTVVIDHACYYHLSYYEYSEMERKLKYARAKIFFHE